MSSAAVVIGALRVKNHIENKGLHYKVLVGMADIVNFITANEQTQSNQVF